MNVNHSGFNDTKDDGMEVTSAEPYANRLDLAPGRYVTTPVPHHSVFTGQIFFLPPNQQL